MHRKRSQRADQAFKTPKCWTGLGEVQNRRWKKCLVEIDGSVGSWQRPENG